MAKKIGVTYSEEVVNKFLKRLETGESLRSICRSPDMPSAETFYDWLEKNKNLPERYARAREKGYDFQAEEMEEIARDENMDVNRARLLIDTRKWLLAKKMPKKYGDKTEVELNGQINFVRMPAVKVIDGAEYRALDIDVGEAPAK